MSSAAKRHSDLRSAQPISNDDQLFALHFVTGAPDAIDRLQRVSDTYLETISQIVLVPEWRQRVDVEVARRANKHRVLFDRLRMSARNFFTRQLRGARAE